MRLIKCNRCKKEKEIKEVKKIGYINLGKRDVVTGEHEGKREFDDWDICDDCLMQIKDFLHMAPLKLKTDESLLMPWAMKQIKATEEPGQQVEEPIAPAQKKQPTIGDTNVKTDSAIAEEPAAVDVDESHGLAVRPKRLKAGTHPKAELMKEMARSGASLTEIMEVAGCSEPTARKYMKEEQDE